MNENDPQTYKDPNQPADISAAHENEGADEMSNPDEGQQTSHVIERSEYDAENGQPTEEPTDTPPAHDEPDVIDPPEDVPEEDPQTSHVIERSEYDEAAENNQPAETTTNVEEDSQVIEAQAEETTTTTAVKPAHPGEGSDVVEAPEVTTTTITESPTATEAVVTVPSQEKPELAETGTDVGGGLLVGTALVLAGITASAKRFLKDRKTPKA